MKTSTNSYPLWLLTLAVALDVSAHILLFAISSLTVLEIGGSQSQATLPYFFGFFGALLSTLPISLAMSRKGRRPLFIAAHLIGAAGMLIMAWGYVNQSLIGLCLGEALFGVQMASGFFFRFAALELAAPGKEHRALGLVFLGGVAAAAFGPSMAEWSKNLYQGSFLGSYMALAGLLLASALVLSRIPMPHEAKPLAPIPWKKALSNRRFYPALIAGMGCYGVMTLFMSVTPMAMKHESLNFGAITLVIQWHLLGMFLPGPLTARLLERWGPRAILALGGFLYLGCFGASFAEPSMTGFLIELTMLGLGWNFSYLAATEILTKALRPGEEGVSQGFNEMVILGTNCLISLSSGPLLAAIGWQGMHWVGLPLILAILTVSLKSPARVAARQEV